MSTAWFDDQPRAWTGPGDPGMGAASAWDTIVIAGWRFYGRISGRVGSKLDVQDRLGKKGASLGNSKRHPAEVDVELWILTAQDMQHLDALLSYLRNDANAKNASVMNRAAVVTVPARRKSTILAPLMLSPPCPSRGEAYLGGVNRLTLDRESELSTRKARSGPPHGRIPRPRAPMPGRSPAGRT